MYRRPLGYQRDMSKIEPLHSILSTENKRRILKTLRKKTQINFKGKPIKLTADLSTGTLKARITWNEAFQVLKENNFKPRLYYPTKLSFIIKGDVGIFQNKQKLK
jgi:hypothetical protein